ncbi:hypothetical protein ACFL03_08655 [Thermodesulfobacteriota bacterium]
MKESPEIEPYKQMVINWKASYLLLVEGTSGNEYLVKDFWEEIEEGILPHVESAGFAGWAFQQVKDLERLIKEIEYKGSSAESIIKGPG